MERKPPGKLGRWLTGATLLYLLIAVLVGSTTGVAAFTFGYAEGAAYLTNRPEACANCHVMQKHYDAWHKSSHGKFATCNDCHAPHDFVGKYYCKSRNGFFHSLAFTTGDFPDNIQMHEYNRNVVEANCRECHQQVIHQMDPEITRSHRLDSTSCLHCHADVGHDT